MNKDKVVPSIDVLSVPIFDGTIEDAYQILKREIELDEKKSLCVSATGAHGLVTAKKDNQFKETLQSFYINLPDGMPCVWVAKLKGGECMSRCYGPDFFEYVLRSTSKSTVRHFFCGGKEGVAEKLKSVCESKFDNQGVVGTFCPPFRELTEEEWSELTDEINNKNVDILWIGISTPKQEKFAEKLSKLVNANFIVTVGAAFDFHIGEVRQAPKLLQKSGLEWLFRLAVEPKRLWKRYFTIVPLFITYNIEDFLFTK